MAFRYLAAPPISEDDLETLAETTMLAAVKDSSGERWDGLLSVIRATLTSTNLTITPVVVKAGDFAFVVRDLSHARGFWLAGSGVTRHTSRTRVGTIRWPITLAPGRYSYGVNGRPVGTLTVDP